MLARLGRWVRARLRRRVLEEELDEEIRFHLDRETERNRRLGMDEAEARAAALRSFGGVARTKEEVRDARGWLLLDGLGQDLRFGLRTMKKNLGFSVVVVATLAIGVGASTTMFSVVDGVLLRPLPYPEPGRLVRIDELRKGTAVPVSQLDFQDWRSQQTVFESMGLYFRSGYVLSAGVPRNLATAKLSVGAFSALGVQPVLGRGFREEDERPGAPPVMLLAQGFWREQFAADPAILGRPIAPGGPVVVGVMPAGFAFPGEASLWEPYEPNRLLTRNRASRIGSAVARLAPGITLEQARVQLDTIARSISDQHPETNRDIAVRVQPLLDSEVGGVRPALYVLLGAAALLLLIACANVAGLLLSRAVARSGELAVRTALGAGRGRLVRQVLTESVLLAAAGSIAGVLLAAAGLRLVVALGQQRIPRLLEVGLDGRVLGFALAAALLTGIGFGLAPAWFVGRRELGAAVRVAGDRVAAGGGGAGRALVIGQVALTLVLLVGAGLLLRSFRHLQAVDLGFSPSERWTFRTGVPERRYGLEQQLAFFDRLLAGVRALPGVTSASLASEIPLDIDDPSIANRLGQPQTRVILEDRPEPPGDALPLVELRFVDPDYFRVMGIPLLRGRGFSARDDRQHLRGTGRERDRVAAMNVVIVDAESARRHWPGEDPIGKRIRLPRGARAQHPVLEVVGVVGRVKLAGLRELGGPIQAYAPFRQAPNPSGATLVVLSRQAREPMVAAARRLTAELAPGEPVFRIETFSGLREKHLAPERLSFLLAAAFAGLALLLALVGLYAVLAYSVAQRRREIAVRVALGAQGRQIAGLVVGQGLRLAATGVALGLVAALAVTRVLGALLYGVTPADPATLGAVVALMLLVALAASQVPAWQAARTDPMTALRRD